MIDQARLDKWREQARRDDWHRTFVGSDIREMLAEIERLQRSNAGLVAGSAFGELLEERLNELLRDIARYKAEIARLEGLLAAERAARLEVLGLGPPTTPQARQKPP